MVILVFTYAILGPWRWLPPRLLPIGRNPVVAVWRQGLGESPFYQDAGRLAPLPGYCRRSLRNIADTFGQERTDAKASLQ